MLLFPYHIISRAIKPIRVNLNNVILAVENRLSDAVATKIFEKFGIESVCEALVPARGSRLNVGNEYNTLLSEFVREHWDLERAAAVSPSLNRTLDRFAEEKIWVLISEQKIPTPH